MVDRPVSNLDSFSTRKYPTPMPRTSFFCPPPLLNVSFNLVLLSSVELSAKWSRLFVARIDFEHGGFALLVGSNNRLFYFVVEGKFVDPPMDT